MKFRWIFSKSTNILNDFFSLSFQRLPFFPLAILCYWVHLEHNFTSQNYSSFMSYVTQEVIAQ